MRRWGQTFAGRRSVSCSTRCWSRCEGETTKFQKDYQLLVQNEACLIHHSLRSILCGHGSQGFIFLRCNLWRQDTQYDIEIIATLSITILNTGMVSVTMPNVSKLRTVVLYLLMRQRLKVKRELSMKSFTLFPTICIYNSYRLQLSRDKTLVVLNFLMNRQRLKVIILPYFLPSAHCLFHDLSALCPLI